MNDISVESDDDNVLLIKDNNPKETEESKPKASVSFQTFIDGISFIRNNPYIFVISLLKACGSITWGGVNIIGYVKVPELMFVINNQPGLSVGIMYAAVGFGTGVGPMIAQKFGSSSLKAFHYSIVIGFFVRTVGLFVIALAPNFALLAIGGFLEGFTGALLVVFSNSILQHVVVDEFRGRTFSFNFAFLTLTMSISYILSSVLIDVYNVSYQWTLFVIAILGTVVQIAPGIYLYRANCEVIEKKYNIHFDEYSLNLD